MLGNESQFHKQYDLLVSQGQVNAVIGSLGVRSAFKFGVEKINPYCKDPLDYVLVSNLLDSNDFHKVFVETAKTVLSDSSTIYKAQGHLTKGFQTAGNIFLQGDVRATEIEKIIRAEIEKYRLYFQDSEEGLIKSWPNFFEIKGWLVRMQSGGSLAPHMHEDGWITGSVYINVAPKQRAEEGSLVLCSNAEADVSRAQPDLQRVIDVHTGSLCLFPSSLWHHTLPFQSNQERIVLAFDVIPKTET